MSARTITATHTSLGAPPITINGPVLHRRRRAAGLSLRDLSAATGIATHLLNQLERGADAGLVNLTQVGRLITVLGCQLDELLRINGAADAVTDQEGNVDDAGQLAAALHRGDLLSRDLLAEAYRWTLDRVERGLLELERRAPAYGWSLVRRGLDVRLLSQMNTVPVDRLATQRRKQQVRARPKVEIAVAVLEAVEAGAVDLAAVGGDCAAEALAAGLLDVQGRAAADVGVSLQLDP